MGKVADKLGIESGVEYDRDADKEWFVVSGVDYKNPREALIAVLALADKTPAPAPEKKPEAAPAPEKKPEAAPAPDSNDDVAKARARMESAKANAEIAAERFDAISQSSASVPGSFVTGRSNQSASLRRRRERLNDKTAEAFKASEKARKEFEIARARLAAVEAGEVHANGQPRADAPSRQRAKAAETAWGDYIRATVKAGDRVTFLPNPDDSGSIVERVNRKTVALHGGSKWDFMSILPWKDGKPQTKSEAIAAYTAWKQQIQNDAPANKQDAQSQMEAVRQRYQGTDQWLKAPNGQPTKLNERQWLQVRTPAFKQWFGDWEYAAHQQAIDKLPTVPVDFELDNAQSLAEARHQALAEAKRRFALDQNPKKVITPNGDGIWIAMSGLKESISKHAGPQKMRILPILDRLIENSHFVLAAPDAKTEQRKTPNILGYRYYVAKAKLGEKAYYVKLAVREVEDRGVKRKFYDHDLSEVSEVTREQGTAHLAAAGNPTAMTSLDHIVHQGWQKFNEEASKVIDENGEPLVVYHGTDADFSQFNISHFGKNDSGWYGKGFYFTPDKDWTFAEDSAERNGGAPNVMPVYLNVKKPVYGYANAEQGSNLVGSAAERGMDGVIVRYDPGHSQEYEIAEIVVTRPTQIKSALGNRGTFDGNEGDITKSFHPTRRALFLKAGFRGIAT